MGIGKMKRIKKTIEGFNQLHTSSSSKLWGHSLFSIFYIWKLIDLNTIFQITHNYSNVWHTHYSSDQVKIQVKILAYLSSFFGPTSNLDLPIWNLELLHTFLAIYSQIIPKMLRFL